MRKVIDFMKGHPVITGIIGVTIGVAATKVLEMDYTVSETINIFSS